MKVENGCNRRVTRFLAAGGDILSASRKICVSLQSEICIFAVGNEEVFGHILDAGPDGFVVAGAGVYRLPH
jgi:hypothetical protein